MGESKSHHLWSVGLSFGIISLIAVLLRVYTRVRIVRSFGADDVLIVIAELFTLAFLTFILVAAANGLGRHIEDITLHEYFIVIKSNWGSSITYTLQIMSAKLSLLFFYLRISGPGGNGLPQWCMISTYSLIVLTILVGVSSGIVVTVQCKPFDYQWNQVVPGTVGKCWNLAVFYYINAGLNIFLDICVTVLPMPVFLGLELPKRQKIGLCGVFALGGLVCAISVVRVVKLPALNRSVDIPWDATDAIMWYYIECTLIVVAACVPSLKPLIRMYAPRLLGSSGVSYDSTRYRKNGYDSSGFRIGGRSFIGEISALPHEHQATTHISSSPSGGGVNKYGECDSEERIIQESIGMSILKTTDVVLTVEDQSELHRGSSRTGPIEIEPLSSVYIKE